MSPPAEDEFYILWNPTSDLPPTVRMYSLKEARETASLMARKHGGKFYICKAGEAVEVAPAPVKITRLKAAR